MNHFGNSFEEKERIEQEIEKPKRVVIDKEMDMEIYLKENKLLASQEDILNMLV